eukprot:CAMPEP_0195125202 /NCGR_PEP_ID=MMETSP0448-20130528/132503_1 /TAXON_ID=66468 /ORGANISM="Heterocapsa triquestra, Strain CCMP 448" /LENGTH=102 /DNA_ID=CAMNT_0040162831 /DNA_START=27 /DNA_END=332 /DNA_ORIENTATION=+
MPSHALRHLLPHPSVVTLGLAAAGDSWNFRSQRIAAHSGAQRGDGELHVKVSGYACYVTCQLLQGPTQVLLVTLGGRGMDVSALCLGSCSNNGQAATALRVG